MALVLEVICFSIFEGSMVHVLISTSTNTGTAPICTMGVTEAINVITGTITSSPGFIPASYSYIYIAAVPL